MRRTIHKQATRAGNLARSVPKGLNVTKKKASETPAERPAPKKRAERSGPYTLFPGKVQRSYRLTPAAIQMFEDIGNRITHPTGKPILSGEVMEALVRLHGARLTYADVVRATKVKG